ALTGRGGSYTLNPYVGCTHMCAYCYASYMSRWKGEGGPWGTWVHVKVNVPEVLKKELSRPSSLVGISVFISTVCDPYQPSEKKYGLTKRCLEVLSEHAQAGTLKVTLATKSDLVLRDLDLFRSFPEGGLRLAFSITTYRDEVASRLEPFSPRPSRRIAAARVLKEAGLRVGFFVCPVLPYLTERDLGGILDVAEELRLDFLSFDTLNYLKGHIRRGIFRAYRTLGDEALRRLEYAKDEPGYAAELREHILRETSGRGIDVEVLF
ncbi:MAG TPA: radical SAM protein, partial [Candidatus Latescibacteria bacterium]|nr:radical SAM protein [Candidatus Latescibacterota bacterium]